MKQSLLITDDFFEVAVRDDLVNGSKMAEDQGKQLRHWLSLEKTQEYVSYLESIKGGIPPLIKEGGEFVKGRRGKTKQTVWLNRYLAYDLAAWISVEFKHAVHVLLDQYFAGGLVPALPEAAALNPDQFVTREEFQELAERSELAVDPRIEEGRALLDLTFRRYCEGRCFKLMLRQLAIHARECGLFLDILKPLSRCQSRDEFTPAMASAFGKVVARLTKSPFSIAGEKWTGIKRLHCGRTCYSFYKTDTEG